MPPLDSFVGKRPSLDSFVGNTPVSAPQGPTTGFFEGIGQRAGKSVADAWTSAYQGVKEGLSQGTVTGGVHAVARSIEGVLAPFGEAVNQVTFGVIPKTVNTTADLITNNKYVSPLYLPTLNKLNDIFDKHPDVKTFVLQDLPTFLNAGSIGVGGGEVKAGNPLDIIKNTTQDIKTAGATVSDLASTAKKGVSNKLENHYVNQSIEDWNRIGGDYVKTDRLLNQEQAKLANTTNPASVQDTPTFLAEHGISPKSLINESGKFDTMEAANRLTTDAVKPFEDTLTAQLKVVQQGQPLVNFSELRSAVASKIDAINNVTEGDRVLMRNAANREIAALQNRYPKGIPLDQLNLQKGNYWRNTKFDLTKPLQPQVNYNIGSAMKDLIEVKAGDANVSELNGLLGNYYKAAKFLRGLNERVPKLTTGQKIVRAAAKTVGVAAGESLFGISGGVGGYMLAKSVSHVLEKASNPVKSMILRNLETANPGAYKEALQWLGKQEAQRLSRLALPAPRPLGSSENPIVPPAPTTFESAAQQIGRINIDRTLRLEGKGKNPMIIERTGAKTTKK